MSGLQPADKMSVKYLSPDECSLSDLIIPFSFPARNEELIKSIQQNGILQPITVQPDGKRYCVIRGAKRSVAAKELNLESIPAIIAESIKTDVEIFFSAFEENRLSRKFNLAEIAAIVSMLHDNFGEDGDSITEKYLAKIGEKGGVRPIKELLAINALSENVKLYIVKWNITLGIISKLLKFTKEEKDAIFEIIEPLNIHGGKLKQMLTLIYDCSKTSDFSAVEICRDRKLNMIIDGDKITGTQKQQKILEFLMEKRYPALTELTKDFYKKAAELKGVGAVNPPDNFEGDGFKMQLTIKKPEDIDRMVKAFGSEENRKIFENLLTLF